MSLSLWTFSANQHLQHPGCQVAFHLDSHGCPLPQQSWVCSFELRQLMKKSSPGQHWVEAWHEHCRDNSKQTCCKPTRMIASTQCPCAEIMWVNVLQQSSNTYCSSEGRGASTTVYCLICMCSYACALTHVLLRMRCYACSYACTLMHACALAHVQ